MTKKQKQPLFLKGFETNPQGDQVPIYTTVEPPAILRELAEQEGNPVGQLKRLSIFAGARKKKKKPEKRSFRAMGGKG